ncbi:hypothetical protein JXM67_13430 [candidate division WOR-3 bacterium]|nr:hypothetical protein [candidate division WOR-3 bacterium]
MPEPRILLLFSGGLDSLLVARVLIEAGAKVEALHIVTPFTGNMQRLAGEQYLTKWGISLRRIRIDVNEFRPLLESPPHGFGRASNPCIDCKILFLRKAREIMEDEGFDAVASGEVLGERPMSQNRVALNKIEQESGLQGYLLRPLSARLLEETVIEEKRLIKREKLLAIEGRSRKPQMELAKRWGIEEYATPSGGCLLTESQYCRKLKDLMVHGEDTEESVALLKTGRHFRHDEGAKCIVGRNEDENAELGKHTGDDRIFLEVKGIGSPLGLLVAKASSSRMIDWAAGILARYSDAKNEKRVNVTWWGRGGEETVSVIPLTDSEIKGSRI